MSKVRRLEFFGVAGLFVAVAQAQAVEYRLQVVNMWDSGFNASSSRESWPTARQVQASRSWWRALIEAMSPGGRS